MKKTNRILLDEIKPYWPRLVLILFSILLVALFETLNPWPFKVLIDNVLGSESIAPGTITYKIISIFRSREMLGYFTALIYCLIILFGSLSEYFSGVVTKKFSKELVRSFSQKIFNSLTGLEFVYFKTKKIGDYIYNLSYDASALGNFVESGLIPLATNLVYILATSVALIIISPKLSLIAFPMVPMLLFGLRIFNNKVGEAANKSEHSSSALLSFIEEVLNQIKIIRAFNQEKKESESFSQKQDLALIDTLNTHGWTLLLDTLVGIVIAIGYSVIVFYGVQSVLAGTITTGLFIIFFFYLDNLINPLMSVMNALGATRENYVKIGQLADLLDNKFQVHDTGTLTEIYNPVISFRDVSLISDDGNVILDKASFQIPAGKKTAIIGVSGSGKTTIANLILRFIDPSNGKILIGDKDIKDYQIKKLRDAITYVPQEIVLLNDSIAENIRFGDNNATAEDIENAAKLAIADDFINGLPYNYNFHVGTSGSNLSGGQRQRILLARSFLKKQSPIVILDEPISALDIKTREKLLNNLDRFSEGKTTVFISNILEIINNTDHVILVNHGKVIYQGDREKLDDISNLTNLILKAS